MNGSIENQGINEQNPQKSIGTVDSGIVYQFYSSQRPKSTQIKSSKTTQSMLN